ncbi:P-loop containing nucleoside triphosphate hydrolase protein [Phlebopus sp. FC_14]|nr:P-loop containing nucleoside triphosphate hydrolase protein [Phlebopus sp. FC_14]
MRISMTGTVCTTGPAARTEGPSDCYGVNETILPRKYQEEIFLRAQSSNIIAALDTGSGKTLISVLLIKHIVLLPSSVRKVVVFLVPKVALVEQQANFIAAQTPLRVRKFHGSLDLEISDRANWKKEFERSDVVVMTAQIFLNILTHSHWSIDKVSLMVFDECHHTRKNHAYNGIMREYFQVHPAERPKIFGMTASPIWNPRDAEGSLLTLERNLDATVIAVREHVSELLENSPRPVEIIKEYDPPPDNYLYLHPSLWDTLTLFRSDLDTIPWDKLEMKYHVTRNGLGPYCADLFVYHEVRARITLILSEMEEAARDQVGDPFGNGIDAMDVDDAPPTGIPSIPAELGQINSILSDFRAFFETPSPNPPSTPSDSCIAPTGPIPVPLAWLTPKVKALTEVLLSYHTTSPTFHGIVFVEQRQVAACLAKVLGCVPELRGRLRCAELVGHGGSGNGSGSSALGGRKKGREKGAGKGMGLVRQQDTVRAFKKSFEDGGLNLLIATSVAEEGLDFPACDLVIRFDPLHHMVGYVQSRGRARTKSSTFVIMVQVGYNTHLDRYRIFQSSEPELKRVYQSRENPTPRAPSPSSASDSEEGELEEDDPEDLAARERYIVPSTGAVLTYGSAIGLINYLCSLIPHDIYTLPQMPKYSGDYAAVLELPASLPLPIDRLVYRGPPRNSKREAKRAVAFLAVKALHKLDVFDDYLLPSTGSKGKSDHDADGRKLLDVSEIPDIIEVLVRDPWTLGPRLRMHVITIDGVDAAGLVTGTELPSLSLMSEGHMVTMRCTDELVFDESEVLEKLQLLEYYTRMGIWFCISGRPITLPITCFLVPLTAHNCIDFDAVQRVVNEPYGTYDWTNVTEKDYDRMMIMNCNQYGRALILHNVRHDLTALSTPTPGSREATFSTFEEYFVQRWTRKNREAFVPTDSPLIEAFALPRHPSGLYRPTNRLQDLDTYKRHTALLGSLIPQGACRRTHFPESVYRAFLFLPRVCRRATDLYRAREERMQLGLPPIEDDLLIEASTLPTTNATWNNQRLETLGDSVLKLTCTVHIMNKYPFRHEGQLSQLRQSSISNRTLLARAKEIGLERFLTSEAQSLHTWRYTIAEDENLVGHLEVAKHTVKREYPRRSLQDCMEATLGAAFLTGGIDMALRAGDALGMSVGGVIPWSLRYSRPPETSRVPPLFEGLQVAMGYQFHRGELLIEAVTHPSFTTSAGSSYQRLEFLGDAVIDLVVMRHLFQKFPDATSGQLSAARSRAVCGPTLASIAVNRLSLQKHLLINNVELSTAISRHVPLLESLSPEDAIIKGWKYDPPKALSDVLESLIGAVLVDSAYDFERTAGVVEMVMSDVIDVLTTNLPRDPVSELMVWAATAGCRRIAFQKSQSNTDLRRNDSVAVVVHDAIVVGPITAANLSLSKGLAAERARAILNDPNFEMNLARLCDCKKAVEASTDIPMEVPNSDETAAPKISDETEEGFAMIAKQKMEQDYVPATGVLDGFEEDELDDDGGLARV